jgi:hypothetical protein
MDMHEEDGSKNAYTSLKTALKTSLEKKINYS